jgi:hypothetical protein
MILIPISIVVVLFLLFLFFLPVRWKIFVLFLLKKQKFCLDQTRFPPVREMEHQREEPALSWRERWCTGEVWSPTSGWVGLRCLHSEAVGWALDFFFFAAGEERDGALERGIGVGLERERWCTGEVWSLAWGGLGSGKNTAAAEEREERERKHKEVGERNHGYVLYGVLILF